MKRLSKAILQTAIAALSLGVAGSAQAAVRYSFNANFNGIAGGPIGFFTFVRPTLIAPNDTLIVAPGALDICSVDSPIGATCGNQRLRSMVSFMNGDIFDIVNFGTASEFSEDILFAAGSLSAFGDYEASNIPNFLTVEFVDTPTVPEPASWALMIAGFGAVGLGMRRRRGSVRVSYA
jgi:hypothetical protein